MSTVVHDQFYTKPVIAKKCLIVLKKQLFSHDINPLDFDIFLEPSAGKGSFFLNLPRSKRIGIDIDPKHPEIKQQDFFTYVPERFHNTEGNMKYITIGNPPFGRVSSLAIKFFNKAAQFSQIIAFIIPRTFKRVSVQNKLDMNFHLVFNKDLPVGSCFEPKMDAKCCFQIWICSELLKNHNHKRQPIVLPTICEDFKFLKMGPLDNNKQPTPPRDADFALKAYGSGCGEVFDTNLHTLRPKSYHWIKSNIPIAELKHIFSKMDYSISKDTVRQESIGRAELIQLYKLYIQKNK